MSRVSSFDQRDFQVFPVQQRPWQSSPDLRMEKWKPISKALSVEDSTTLDVVEVMKTNKKQFLAQLFQERTAEAESYR